METDRTPLSPDAASLDAAVFPATLAPEAAPAPDPAEPPARRCGWIDGHLPESLDSLVPRHRDTVFSETRRLRHDGWSPEKMRLFLERFAECGVLVDACQAAGMSARSAYNLRDRDPLFAAGWEAARVQARQRLADEAYSRAVNGVVERIYKDGLIVAEKHRYDNRLTMSVLARLDARLDRAEERGDPHLALVARWDEYLAALGEDRRADLLALLAPSEPEPETDLQESAGDRELHELRSGAAADSDREGEADPHDVWEEEGRWWTNYPPPPGFDGEAEGAYEDYDYRRALSPAEQAVIDAEAPALEAEAAAQRDAYFGFEPEAGPDPEPATSSTSVAPAVPQPVRFERSSSGAENEVEKPSHATSPPPSLRAQRSNPGASAAAPDCVAHARKDDGGAGST